MNLDQILQDRGTSLREIEEKQAELKRKLAEQSGHSKVKRQIKQQLYRIDDFLSANSQARVELRKDQVKTFEWNPSKDDNWMTPPWQRGGWDYTGLYLGTSFYSLWINMPRYNLVHLCKDNKTFHLFSRRKDYPLELIEQKLATDVTEETLFRLRDGDIITARGIALFGTNRDYASELFAKVLTGIEILPKPKYGRPYTERVRKGGKGAKTLPRTDGQVFLQDLNPTEVIQGQVFGSGTSYKAYVFGQKVIVEADETARATYLFTRQEFDTLRQMSRSQILDLDPDGYEGRVIHQKDGLEDWKTYISGHLKISAD